MQRQECEEEDLAPGLRKIGLRIVQLHQLLELLNDQAFLRIDAKGPGPGPLIRTDPSR